MQVSFTGINNVKILRSQKQHYGMFQDADNEIKEASDGITLTDMDKPVKLHPAVLEIKDTNTAFITLTEGKTHEVRRIFAHWDRPVTALRRISVGPVVLDDDLEEGCIRELTDQEVSSLKTITKLL